MLDQTQVPHGLRESAPTAAQAGYKIAGINLYACFGPGSVHVEESAPAIDGSPVQYKLRLVSGDIVFDKRYQVEAPLSDAQISFLCDPSSEKFSLDHVSVGQIERRFSDGSIAEAAFADPRSPILEKDYYIYRPSQSATGSIKLVRDSSSCFLCSDTAYHVSASGLNFHRIEITKVMELTESQFLRLLPLSKDYSPDREPRYA